MYLQTIESILQSHEVKIKYDCDGNFQRCGQEAMLKLKYAEKNYKDNGGKHICRQCQLRAKNPMKKKEIRDKVKKTCLEKYGTESPLNSEANIQNRREQFQDEGFKEQWLKKRKETCLEKYGVEHHMKSDISKENQKKAMNEKYGVDHPYQSPKIMAKMKANNLAKHGVENVAQLPEVQIKMAKTTLERYGVEHYNELPKMKEYLRQNCPDWLKESWERGRPNKGIVRPEEWNRKQSETVSSMIVDGKWTQGGYKTYKGKYKSKKCLKPIALFRSGYELQVHIWLDANEDVAYYDYEPFQIPYHDTENKLRHYVIDFIIIFKDGTKKILEIKNNYNKQEFLDNGKYQALIDLCKEYNLQHEIWTNEKIKSLGYKLKELLVLEQVELFGLTE